MSQKSMEHIHEKLKMTDPSARVRQWTKLHTFIFVNQNFYFEFPPKKFNRISAEFCEALNWPLAVVP